MPIILKKEAEQGWLNGNDYNKIAFPYSFNLVATSLEKNTDQLNLFWSLDSTSNKNEENCR